jgi:RNA polymerase sigma-70 factor (ECF subfamily)
MPDDGPTARQRDADLVAAAAAGDVSALESLLRKHADAVYGHALRFFGDPDAAEDAVQEVFVKVYRSLSGFKGEAAFSTWLFRVTRNVCLDLLRAGKRRPVPMDPLDLPQRSKSDIADPVIASAALEEALATLPPEERDAFNAISLFALDYREAAEVLGVPVGTVKSRVFRARRALVTVLGLHVPERSA